MKKYNKGKKMGMKGMENLTIKVTLTLLIVILFSEWMLLFLSCISPPLLSPLISPSPL